MRIASVYMYHYHRLLLCISKHTASYIILQIFVICKYFYTIICNFYKFAFFKLVFREK